MLEREESLKHIDLSLKNYYTRITCSINLCVGICALPLASLILVSAKKVLKSNKTTSLRLILIVLCLDIISCFSYIVISISVLAKIDFIAKFPVACTLSYFFFDGSILLSLWFLALVSLERYFHIVLEIQVRPVIWYVIMILLFVIILFVGIFSIATDTFVVMPMAAYCFLSAEDARGHINLLIISVLNWISVLIVLFSYTSILIYTLKIRYLAKSPVINQELKAFHNQLNLTIIKVILILSFYLLTNSYETYLEVWATITKMDRDQQADFIANALQNFNPLINCILLLLINRDISQYLIEMLTNKR
jgi:hypothetical protein